MMKSTKSRLLFVHIGPTALHMIVVLTGDRLYNIHNRNSSGEAFTESAWITRHNMHFEPIFWTHFKLYSEVV